MGIKSSRLIDTVKKQVFTFCKTFDYGPFFAHMHLKFSKSTNMTTTNFFTTKSIWVSKNAESYVDFKFVEVVSKKLPKISRLLVYTMTYSIL